jgi:hypothetical protein
MFHRLKNKLEDIYLTHFDKFFKHEFDFAYLDIHDLKNYKHSLEDIYEGKTDGIVIKNVLSSIEVNRILNSVKLLQEDIYKIRFGNTYGHTLSDSNDEAYFKLASHFVPKLRTLMSDDVFERINHCFETIAKNKKAEIAKLSNGQEFLPATVRMLQPGKGGLPIHCERATTTDIDPISKGVKAAFHGANIISYFIVLQNTEKGGSLIIFDDNTYTVGKGLKSVKELLFKPGQKIKPQPGDMLIFNGGTIWHKVEEIKGKSERITYAGFLDMNAEKSKWIYWS